MRRGLDWERARERDKMRQPKRVRLPKDRRKPVSPAQTRYLKRLAAEQGREAPQPASAYQAYLAIRQLKRTASHRLS